MGRRRCVVRALRDRSSLSHRRPFIPPLIVWRCDARAKDCSRQAHSTGDLERVGIFQERPAPREFLNYSTSMIVRHQTEPSNAVKAKNQSRPAQRKSWLTVGQHLYVFPRYRPNRRVSRGHQPAGSVNILSVMGVTYLGWLDKSSRPPTMLPLSKVSTILYLFPSKY